MLDRTIPFYNTIMKCSDYRYRDVKLPDGFSIVSYRDGYEKEWAKLEYAIARSVLIFLLYRGYNAWTNGLKTENCRII